MAMTSRSSLRRGPQAGCLEQMHAIKNIDPDIKQLDYMDVAYEQKPVYCPTD